MLSPLRWEDGTLLMLDQTRLPGEEVWLRCERPEDVADAIPCGPDVEPILDAVGEFVEAGFTDVAIVQVGDQGQQDFLDFAESTLLPALRERHGSTQTAKSA